MRLISLLIAVLLFSCTPEKRVARLIKKYHLEKSDTIFKIDTVTTQSVKRDTSFHFFQRDSVIVREGKLVMKYFYNSHDSTIYLKGECLPDTIIREIPMQVNSVSVNEGNGFLEHFKNPFNWLVIIVLIIILLKK